MTKDKVIRVRANDYDKAVLKALTDKFNSSRTMPITFSDSDMVRYAIDQLVKEHLSSDQLKAIKAKLEN